MFSLRIAELCRWNSQVLKASQVQDLFESKSRGRTRFSKLPKALILSIWPKKNNFSLCEESGLHVNVPSALLAPDRVVVLACWSFPVRVLHWERVLQLHHLKVLSEAVSESDPANLDDFLSPHRPPPEGDSAWSCGSEWPVIMGGRARGFCSLSRWERNCFAHHPKPP